MRKIIQLEAAFLRATWHQEISSVPQSLSTGLPVQVCFRIPRVLFQPHSKDHGENSGIRKDTKEFCGLCHAGKR